MRNAQPCTLAEHANTTRPRMIALEAIFFSYQDENLLIMLFSHDVFYENDRVYVLASPP